MSLLSDDEYTDSLSFLIEKARTCFLTYCLLMNPPEDSDIIVSQCHEYLIDLVQGVYDGDFGTRQAVSMPPQHGKSRFLSIEGVSWILGRNPKLNIAITCFSHELVTDFSVAVRNRVQSGLYRSIFPELEIGSICRDDYWTTTKGGAIRAKSAGKKLTGRRVDWLIVDDAHAGRDEADSKTKREKVIKWYLADCRSRLSPEAKVFLIGTRWHPEDLIGTLTSDESTRILEDYGAEDEIFQVTNMPAVCENEDTDPLGRSVGEVLFPEMRGERFLNSTKAAYEAEGSLYEWDSQYQGRPRITGGGQADVDKLVIISEEQVPKGIEFVRGWDLAVSEKQVADYTAGALCGYDENTDTLYIKDVYRNQLSWPKNQKIIRDKGKEEKVRLRIEAVAGFMACYQTVKADLLGVCQVERSKAKGDKLVRANRWLPKVEASRVFLVRGRWNQPFKDELESFPLGKNDDQVDAVSIAWELLEFKAKRAKKEREGKGRPSGRPKSNRPNRAEKERPSPERGRSRVS